MDSPPSKLFDELDLTPEELRIKRKADFVFFLRGGKMPLWFVVLLSLGILPRWEYRLTEPRRLDRVPFYLEEAHFGSMQRSNQFHYRMARAIVAHRHGLLKCEPDLVSARESDYWVWIHEFERWANEAGFDLPEEWRAETQRPINETIKQPRRQQNNLLRIIRALMRARHIRGTNALWPIVEGAALAVPLTRSIVERFLSVLPLEGKEKEDMSAHEKQLLLQAPQSDELIGIIAALLSTDKSIELRLRGNAAKRVDIWVSKDHAKLGHKSDLGPELRTIRKILTKVRLAIVNVDSNAN